MAATPISRDGIFSVALSLPCGIRASLILQGEYVNLLISKDGLASFHLFHKTVRITDHPALRSSDFPPLSHLAKRMLRGAAICSPSIPPFFFFPYDPSLNRLIGQSVCFLVFLPWDGLDLKRNKFF
jgi:hypothetical protein